MFDRASLKLGLDKAVLQSMGPKDLNAVCMFLVLVITRKQFVSPVVWLNLRIHSPITVALLNGL